MHVMFIHPNFPAQFGQAAYYLSTQLGWTCTYVTSVDTTQMQLPFNHINYRVAVEPRASRNAGSLQIGLPFPPDTNVPPPRLVHNGDDLQIVIPLPPGTETLQPRLSHNPDSLHIALPLPPETNVLPPRVFRNGTDAQIVLPLPSGKELPQARVFRNPDNLQIVVPYPQGTDAPQPRVSRGPDGLQIVLPLLPDTDVPQSRVFHNPDSLQGLMGHLLPIYAGLRGVPQVVPDLVVGHMSYGTMLYLRTLYGCPFVGYFEMLPPPYWTDALVLRKEFPPPEGVRLFNATYHALTYMHLHMVDGMYTPTQFQLNTLPPEFRSRCKVIHDGVDCEFFQPRAVPRPVEFCGVPLGPDTRVVTYVSPGLESVRGFDIFMKAAQKIAQQLPNVVFLIAGDARTAYGHEGHHLGQQSFKDWVLAQDNYNPDRFRFLGLIPPKDLATLFNLSDLHVYLTVPHIVSTSLVQAQASGCVVLASNTAPVMEFIEAGVTGLLADFYDVDGLAERAVRVLKDPAVYRPLGEAARQQTLERYEVKHCLNELAAYFQSFQLQARDDVFASMGEVKLP